MPQAPSSSSPGGLDSTTMLAYAVDRGFDVHAMTFRYGQRHAARSRRRGASRSTIGVRDHVVVDIDLRTFGGSALTADIDVPKDRPPTRDGARHPDHVRPGAQHDLPLLLPRVGGGARRVRTSSSASTRSTTPAIPTAAPSTSRRSSAWPISPRAAAWRARRRPHPDAAARISPSARSSQLGRSLGVDYAHDAELLRPDAPTVDACGHCDACSSASRASPKRASPIPTRVRRGVAERA